MRLFFLVLLFILFAGNLFSQDTIIWYNGKKDAVKVVKVSESDIEYLIFNDLLGTINRVSKTKAFLIKYQNGMIDYFPAEVFDGFEMQYDQLTFANGIWHHSEALEHKEILVLYEDSPLAYYQYRKARTLNVFGITFGAIGGLGLGIAFGTAIAGQDFPTGIFIAGLGFSGAAIIMEVFANKKIKKSVIIYNSGLNNFSNNFSIDFGFTRYGIGLQMQL